MTFIVPMAGRGSRFVKEGYKLPKFMIEVKGKTLFEYSMDSLPIDIADKIVFICLKEHEKFNVSEFIRNKVDHHNIKIISIDEVTRGQAETVYLSRNFVKDDEDILIYNIDTYFKSNMLKEILLDNDKKKDGILGAFIDETEDDKWSFAQLDDSENIKKTTEKDKISNFALTGVYHFTVASDFFNIAKNWIENNKTVREEFYIAPMYNDLIAEGKIFKLDIVDEFIPLGTPAEVKEFEKRG